VIVAEKPEGICSGRGCANPSVGSVQECHLIPAWRKPVEYPDRHRGFELGEKVHYCAEHREDAEGYSLAAHLDNLRCFYPKYILEVLGRDRLILLANSAAV
jgi:hypothetical protein